MKKFLLMAACLLAAPHVVGTSANATVTVTTAADDAKDVTITTTAEGEIGVYETRNYNAGYFFASGISEADQTTIKNATKLTIKGNVNSIDMITLFSQFPHGTKENTSDQNNYTLTYLDMSEATIDQFGVICENYTYRWNILPNGWTGWNAVKYFALPKTKGKTEVPGKFTETKEDGTVSVVSEYNLKSLMGNLETVVIPEGYTSIGYGAFDGLYSLSSVTLPEGLETIGTRAFYQCKGLHSIKFPVSLKRVEDYAFSLADLKGSILFPENVEWLGEGAFAGQQSEDVTDVYFQGRKSPECAYSVFGSGQYAGYSGFENPGGTTASRANYYANGHTFCILHFRPDLTAEELKTYWDNTRVYTYNDLYLGSERKWPKHEEFVQAHNYIYFHGTTDGIGTGDATHYDNTKLDEEELKHIGILRFTLGRADAPIPDDGPEISDDDWWTICIPYTLTKQEVMDIFGEGTQLYGLQKVTRDYNTNKVRLSFTYNVFNESGNARQLGDGFTGNSLQAGKLTAWWPYMIKPGKKLDTDTEGAKYFTFSNRLPDAGSEISDLIPATLVNSNEGTGTEWRYIFRGNCSGVSGSTTGIVYHRPAYCYFLGWDSSLREGAGAPAFYYQHNPSTQKVWTHYTCTVIPVKHTVTGGTTSDQTGIDDSFSGTAAGSDNSKTQSFFGTDDDVTAIEKIEILNPEVATDGDIYNLNGVLVRKNALSTEGLAKGIYVCNGKKFVVK